MGANNGESYQLELVPARNGDKTLKVSFAGGREYWLHSRYDPRAEARAWAASKDGSIKEPAVVLVLGVGLGYHVQELLKRYEDISALVIDPLLKESCLGEDSALDHDERLHLFADNDPLRLKAFLGAHIPAYKLGDLRLLPYEPAINAFPAWFADALSAINDEVNSLIINFNTVNFFARQWTKNFFTNLPAILQASPVQPWFGSFKNQPAIIIAAGPSLDKNVRFLAEVRGRAIMMAVGTALKALNANQIVPDLAISIDGGEANYRHFEHIWSAGLEQQYAHLPLIFDPTIYPRIPREWPGPKVAAIANPSTAQWFAGSLGELGKLNAGPSVANVAFDLAYKMGCNPIILMGQDLAYPGGRSHAKGTTWEAVDPMKKAPTSILEVDDIYGGKVWTDRSLYSMLVWFEDYLRLLGDKVRVIDATEGGARIRGTEIMTFREVLDRVLDLPVTFKSSLPSLLHPLPEHEDKQSQLATEMKATVEQLEAVKNLAWSAKKLARKLEDAYAMGLPKATRLDRLNQRLDSLDQDIKSCEEATKLMQLAFEPIHALIHIALRAPEGETEIQHGRRVAKASAMLYESIIKTAEDVEAILQESPLAPSI